MTTRGWHGQYLAVDLSTQNTRTVQLDPAVLQRFVGGRGLGVYLLNELLRKHIEPFDPDNPLIFSVGPLVGMRENILGATRFTITAISPLTGLLGDANSGGDVGYAIRLNGYDGLIITGKLERPGILFLRKSGIEILDGEQTWGMTVSDCCDFLRRRFPNAAVSCIGPAGENMVRYAAIVNEPMRLAGRCGLGAVMGSKKLKAVLVIVGDRYPTAANSRGVQSVLRDSLKGNKTERFSYWERHGTLQMVEILGLFKRIPSRYWSGVDIPHVDNVAASAFLKVNKFEKVGGACNTYTGCVLSCTSYYLSQRSFFGPIARALRKLERRWIIHYVVLRPVKRRILRLLGRTQRGPEYEGVGCWAGLCGVKSATEIISLNHLCNDLGLDVISAANVIAFAIKCMEMGIRLPSGLKLDLGWGESEKIAGVIRDIAVNKDCASVLALGVKRMSELLGKEAERIAVHTKGLEWEASELRGWIGGTFAHVVASRGGDHERGMPMLEMTAYLPYSRMSEKDSRSDDSLLDPQSYSGKAKLVKLYEDHKVLLDSLGICHFYCPLKLQSRGDFGHSVYSRNELLGLYGNTTGFNLPEDEITDLGDRVISIEREVNIKQGLTATDDCCPARFTEEAIEIQGLEHKIDKNQIARLVNEYYELRGWN